MIQSANRFGKTEALRRSMRERLERGESVTMMVHSESDKAMWSDLVKEFPETFYVWAPPPGVRVQRISDHEDIWFY